MTLAYQKLSVDLAGNPFLSVNFNPSGLSYIFSLHFSDTEGSFMIERVTDIASSFSQHVRRMAEKRADPVLIEAASRITTEYVLSTIHYFRIQDFVEQLALIRTLPSFLEKHPEVILFFLFDFSKKNQISR